MLIKWVDDDAAKVVLANMGIHCEERTIPAKDINRKLSAQNRARKISLDETRIDGIKSAAKKGVPIPKIVVRVTDEEGFVVAGGNHRLAAMNGEPSLPVHVIDCTDSEFEIAVRVLNTVVGEGMTKAERIESAADAVSRLGLTQKQAAELYGVSRGEMQNFAEQAKAEALLATLNMKGASRLTKTHVKVLGDLSGNTNILRAAAQATIAGKLTTEELADLAKVARKQNTEAAQVRVFEERADVAEKSETVVPRKLKKRFLSSLSQLRAFSGSKTWSSLEIKKDEIELLVPQLREVRDMLNSLLKANG